MEPPVAPKKATVRLVAVMADGKSGDGVGEATTTYLFNVRVRSTVSGKDVGRHAVDNLCSSRQAC